MTEEEEGEGEEGEEIQLKTKTEMAARMATATATALIPCSSKCTTTHRSRAVILRSLSLGDRFVATQTLARLSSRGTSRFAMPAGRLPQKLEACSRWRGPWSSCEHSTA